MYFVNGKWVQKETKDLKSNHSILAKSANYELFEGVLKTDGRWKDDITYTFKPCPENVLNLMSGTFLKPKSGEHHFLFDLLIRSLGNDKRENIEHLEQIVVSKYRSPENYGLPAIIFSDPQGGSGKNVWVEFVLGGIFGRNQTLVSDISALTGSFNGQIAGKAVVMINESAVNRDSLNKVKNLVGQQSFVISEKYEKSYPADNTALYVFASNSEYGTLHIEQNATTRRFSFITPSAKTLVGFVADYFSEQGISDDPAQWLNTEGKRITSDADEVAKYLGYLLDKYPDLTGEYLRALHGDDFNQVADAQFENSYEDIAEQVCDLIFRNPRKVFRSIKKTTLYEFYAHECKKAGLAMPSQPRFSKLIKKWSEVHGSVVNEERTSNMRCWVADGCTPEDTDMLYKCEHGGWTYTL